MKKQLAVVLFFALFFSLLALNISSPAALAQDSALPVHRVGGDSVRYAHIKNITAFSATDVLFYSDESTLYRNYQAVGANATSVAAYQGYVLTAKGGIYNGGVQIESGNYSLISVRGDTLFASSGADIYVYYISENQGELSLHLQSMFSGGGTVTSLASNAVNTYFTVDGSSDVYKVNTASTGFGVVKQNVINLKAVAANTNSNLIYCLTKSDVISYIDIGTLSEQNRMNSDGASFLAAGTLCLYLASLNAGSYTIYSAPLSLGQLSVVSASGYDGEYFYLFPSGISTRFGNIYVADTKNNRISVIDADGVSYITDYSLNGNNYLYIEPKSVALSMTGEMFVAHSNKLTNHVSGRTLELFENELPITIEKLLCDTLGNVYVLGVYAYTNEWYVYSVDSALTTFSRLPLDSPGAMGVQTGGSVLFYADGAVRNLDGEVILECETLSDFALDYSGKLFGINSDKNLISIKNGISTNHGGRFDRLTLSTVSGEHCAYGDILLTSSDTHSLVKILAADAGVADISDYFDLPDIEGDFSSHAKLNGAVAEVKYNAPLYSQPAEAGSSYTVPTGGDVFIRYDVDAPDDMYFVLAEDKQGGALRYGYIYKSALNAPYEYILPYKNSGRLVASTDNHLYIYKYPSLYANRVQKSEKLVRLLRFAGNSGLESGERKWYEDINGHRWVRVDLGDTEGYILEDGLSWSLFSSSAAQPNWNATVNDYAPVYVLENGQYVYFDDLNPIEKGRKIEVKTPFDSSSKYTQVIFTAVNEDGVTEVIDIECYVLTKHVDYEGLDVLQIVSIVAAVAAVLLAIILAVWLSSRRRRKKAYKV